MELSDFEIATEPQKLKIKHPTTGKETDIIIDVISPDHPEYKAKAIEAARNSIKPGEKPDLKAIVDRKSEFVSRLITGWEGVQIKGKSFKYTQANAVRLVNDFPWIADQIDSFCANRSNFFKGSKTT